MGLEIKAPQFPESVAEGTITTFHKQVGDFVSQDELVVEIETDKVVLEVVAPADGKIDKLLFAEGDTIESMAVIANLDTSAEAGTSAVKTSDSTPSVTSQTDEAADTIKAGPAARKLMSETNTSPVGLSGSGKGGVITKDDVLQSKSTVSSAGVSAAPDLLPARSEKRVPMTRLRSRVAERLMEAKNNTAMLTTFNEVNMKPVMELRKQYKDAFEKRHQVKLGFMSFFVQAAIEALKQFPAVNASIDEKDIVYHNYFDIGVAVSSDRGLVVPVIRDANLLSFSGIESKIVEFGGKAKAGKLSLDELTGGTFTISNGGIFGSLLSTPILNPPQTAILGMHKIQERPMAVNGQVEILPMMYLALSYDHRLIDGKEAVQFLVTIKDMIEDPTRLLLEV